MPEGIRDTGGLFVRAIGTDVDAIDFDTICRVRKFRNSPTQMASSCSFKRRSRRRMNRRWEAASFHEFLMFDQGYFGLKFELLVVAMPILNRKFY